MQLPLIQDEDALYSQEILESFYRDDFIPAEKKNYLSHLAKSTGPYLGVAGKSGETKYLLDAASQIATMGLGFSSPAMMGAAQWAEAWLNIDDSDRVKQLRKSFADFLRRKCGWKNITMLLSNSGAEANEIALGICYARRYNHSARKVLAFDGSFHGRTVAALHSTWSPSKREPFEWPEYKTTFCPYPSMHTDIISQEIPENWHDVWDRAPAKGISIPETWQQDDLLKREIDCLLKVCKQLSSGEYFAVIVEPMQCEGGDRYSSNRFHTALLLAARSFGVPVIYDEVQTGFHLSKKFFWHKRFDLRDNEGNPLLPDFVVCAKKAQLGITITPIADFAPDSLESRQEYSATGLIRGYIQGMAMDQSTAKIVEIEKWSRSALIKLATKFKDHLLSPRAEGLSFALELKKPELLGEFVKHRFEHALLFYPAGDSSLRFRLNTSFDSSDVDFLFEQLEAIGNRVFLNKSVDLPTHVTTRDRNVDEQYLWQEKLLEVKSKRLLGQTIKPDELLSQLQSLIKQDLSLVIINKDNFKQYREQVLELQQVYEPARQTEATNFANAAEDEAGCCMGIIDKNNKLIAITFAARLSLFPGDRGLRRDPYFDREDCLYAQDTTVAPNMQGKGIGRILKFANIIMAANCDIIHIQGRNRDQMAADMIKINLSLGAMELFHLPEDYLDDKGPRDCVYYTCPLQWERPPLRLSNAIKSPDGVASLSTDYTTKKIPTMTNKMCLGNFVSTDFLEDMRYIFSHLPEELRHGYSTSGQSECVDKIAKSLWVHNKITSRMLTFEQHYFGNGTFLSRCLSSPDDDFFYVDTLPTPTGENAREILELIADLFSNNDYLAVWIEPLPQLVLEPTPPEFLAILRKLCDKHGVSLVFNDTASARFAYNREHYFASGNKEFTPDMGMSFLGGQAGIVFSRKQYWVGTPLMLISTWDGDEISFASYRNDMQEIIDNKDEFKKIMKQFEQKLRNTLEEYTIEYIYLRQGRGRFDGDIPYSLQQLFEYWNKFYLVNPSFDMMKRFVGAI